MAEVLSATTADIDDLEQISGGMKQGGSWRANLDDDATWDAIVEAYSKSLASIGHRGISNLSNKGIGKVTKSVAKGDGGPRCIGQRQEV